MSLENEHIVVAHLVECIIFSVLTYIKIQKIFKKK